MELLHEACQLNNAGAALLGSNKGSSAVHMLKKALVIMERLSRDEGSEDLIMMTTEEASAETEAIHQPFVEVPRMQDTFFVYNRALVLTDGNGISVDLAFSNATILFNLALAFHQRGWAFCEEAKLRRAIHLYDLVVRLVSHSDSSARHGTLAIVALNNQAHVHRELCEFQEACLILDEVFTVAEHVLPSQESPLSSSDAFGSALLDEIFLNATISSQMPSTAASA